MYVFLALSGFLVTVAAGGGGQSPGHDQGPPLLRPSAGRRLLPAGWPWWSCGWWWWPCSPTPAGRPPPPVGARRPHRPRGGLEGSLGALGYLTNWLDILGLYGGRFPLGHLWFLAAQEQLYLLWVPGAGPAGRALPPAGGARRTGPVGWRRRPGRCCSCTGAPTGCGIYAGTDTRAAVDLVGQRAGHRAGARAASMGWPDGAWGTVVRSRPVAVLVWALFAFSTRPRLRSTDGVAWVAATLAGAVLVVAVAMAEAGWLHRLLGHRVLGYLGSRSYGLYLWHYVWLTWLAGFGLMGILAPCSPRWCAPRHRGGWSSCGFGSRSTCTPASPQRPWGRHGPPTCLEPRSRPPPSWGHAAALRSAAPTSTTPARRIPRASVVERVVDHLRLEAEIGGLRGGRAGGRRAGRGPRGDRDGHGRARRRRRGGGERHPGLVDHRLVHGPEPGWGPGTGWWSTSSPT